MRCGTALLLSAAIVMSACRHDTLVVPLQVGSPVSPALDTTADICRVVVVTKVTCGVSRALSEDWNASLQAIADSVEVHPALAWVTAAEHAKDTIGVRSYWQHAPIVFRVGRPEAVLAPVEGTTPTTLVINASHRVEAIIRGNFLPPAEMLRHACRP